MYLSKLAFEFEQYIVDPKLISKKDLPKEIERYISLWKEAEETGNWFNSEYMKEYGGPTAIAKHPEYGWALLGAGQGPFIMWCETALSE